jgi:hypothetical protein
MKRIIHAISILLLITICTPRAYAVNFQDLWWNPAESGWGVNIAQQGDTLFATWFIYGANREPYWVVMPGTTRVNALVAGETIYTGDIFQTRGTPFNVLPFVPLPGSDVSRVGSATFRFTDAKRGVLTYTINNQTVTKNITRQNIVSINLSGNYYGGFQREASGCANNQNNGSQLQQAVYIINTPSQSNTFSMTEVGGDSCRFTGTYTQYGSMYEASGSYTCAGYTGNWTATEGTVGDNTFSMKLNLTRTGESCMITGAIGGFKP